MWKATGVAAIVALMLFSVFGPLFAMRLVARANDDRWKWALMPFLFTPLVALGDVVCGNATAAPWCLASQGGAVVLLVAFLGGHRRRELVLGLLALLASLLLTVVVHSASGATPCSFG